MTDSVEHDGAALLAHADWVRRLARHLTADAHAADDLAQDAFAAALARFPRGGGSLRAWLAGVLRNLSLEERRAAGNRRARERAAARDEADGSSAELLERLDSHRAVVEAVARLDEPYRAAILMRYFEGLAPAAIAARTGTPLRTVHTRLTRALARLRVDLDRAHGGDRRAWLLALIPYARGSGGWSTAALGALLMDAKLKLGVAVLAVLGVCSTLVLWRNGENEAAPPPLARAEEAPPLEAPSAPEVESAELARPGAERRALEADVPRAEAPAPAAPLASLAGRVIDAERAPVPRIAVRWQPADGGDALAAETDAAGAFALERPSGGGRLDVATSGWTALYRPQFDEAPDEGELVLVVARSIGLAGTVRDTHGRPVSGAEVAVPLPFHLRARFDAILDRASSTERGTTSGADGRFALEDVPVVPDLELVTSHPGHESDERPLPEYDEPALEIVLRPVAGAPDRIVGTVVDPAGEPVAGAWVALDGASARSGPAGEFALELDAAGNDVAAGYSAAGLLRAVAPGYLPGELSREGGEPWPEPLVVTLGDPPLAISGRVVDASGAPIPRAEIWAEGESHFGFVEIEGGEMAMRAGANVEALLRDDPFTWRRAADQDGRFELGGLLPRAYVLRAFDSRRMLATSLEVEAGAREVELRMPADELHARVAGVVTDLEGEPLAGVRVVLSRAPIGGGGPAFLLQSRGATTDAEGRFEFEGVSRAVDAVTVQGPDFGLEGFERALGPGDDVERLELAVPMRAHVQVDAGEGSPFDRVAMLDGSGRRLTLSIHHGQSSYATDEIVLERGRSESFSVSQLARTLVLLSKGAEVRRVPVELVRGELNTLRP